MGNVHGYDVKCGDIHGKEFLNYSKCCQESSQRLTLKQMFDVTAQLVNNQEEINGLDKILWGKNSWTRLSLIDDEIVINLQRAKVYSDSVVSRKSSSTSRIQRSLEEQNCRDPIREKLQRL